jgi:hypothetical protein
VPCLLGVGSDSWWCFLNYFLETAPQTLSIVGTKYRSSDLLARATSRMTINLVKRSIRRGITITIVATQSHNPTFFLNRCHSKSKLFLQRKKRFICGMVVVSNANHHNVETKKKSSTPQIPEVVSLLPVVHHDCH